jgi:hypothetical protein
VQPHPVFLRDTRDPTERRVLRLRGQQLGLGDERQLDELSERLHRSVPEPLAVERRPGANPLDLRGEPLLLQPELLLERELLYLAHAPILTEDGARGVCPWPLPSGFAE